MDDSKPFKATQNHNTEKVTTLLENKLLTLVVFNFQHWFSTDVEITDVNIINVNIGFQKIDVNIHSTNIDHTAKNQTFLNLLVLFFFSFFNQNKHMQLISKTRPSRSPTSLKK